MLTSEYLINVSFRALANSFKQQLIKMYKINAIFFNVKENVLMTIGVARRNILGEKHEEILKSKERTK
jgi:hypothetical protein